MKPVQIQTNKMKTHLIKSIPLPLMMLLLAFTGFAWAAPSESDTSYSNQECIECHQLGSEESDLQISLEVYQNSAHGTELTCLDCHTGIRDEAHIDEEGSGRVDCNECHEQENRHGAGSPKKAKADIAQQPQCHDCHTRHNIRGKDDPDSTVHASQLPGTCHSCHPVQSGAKTFFSWLPAFQIASHPKADFAMAYETENCLGCHQGKGAHGDDQPINDQQCYKCHGASDAKGAMWGYIHPNPDADLQPTVFASAIIYQIALAGFFIVLLGMFLNLVFDRIPTKDSKKHLNSGDKS
jgi:hypothetical protein